MISGKQYSIAVFSEAFWWYLVFTEALETFLRDSLQRDQRTYKIVPEGIEAGKPHV